MNPSSPTPSGPTAVGPPCPPPIRFRCPDRSILADPRSLDQLLPDDHPVRALWQQVEAMDLALLLQGYKARHGRPGRPPIDVRILVALWLYATDQGVCCASQLDRLCRDHLVYRWICGGVAVNPHSLSDFRVAHLDWLLHQFRLGVADLIADGLVGLDRRG